MNATEKIKKLLEKILQEMSLDEQVEVSISENPDHGDYASNIALKLSKKLGKNPREIADKIALEIRNLKLEILDRVEVAGAGFLNFYLSKNSLIENLSSILQDKDAYGNFNMLENKKIMVEFTDPNPLKEFHIGHLYSNAVGESLSRLLESQGATVWRVCYQGDVGLHVAKALWGVLNHESGIKNHEGKSFDARAKFLGESYAMGAKAFEENESAKQEIIELNQKVYAKDPEIYPLYEKAKQWSLDYFETLYSRLGTKFMRYYFESEAGEVGLKLVTEFLEKGMFEKSDGAVIFRGEEKGLHNRVFINSLGLPTYEAKEMGLAPTKYKDFAYDSSIIITGNEVSGYFKVVLAALAEINPELAKKTRHIGHGMVRLPSGKMSSRTGDVITGDFLLEETKKKLESAYPEMDADVCEKLAVGAVKYALLKSSIGQDITFSFEESISLHGNSGPYLQYAYARAQSVLGKRKGEREKGKVEFESIKLEAEELNVLRILVHFPEVVEVAVRDFSPSNLCTYLFELAQKFSLFYEKHRIVNAEDLESRNFRIALTDGVGQVLKNGLYLLGIKAPEKI